MKIYEKPSVDIKMFDVEDIMASGEYGTDNAMFADITTDTSVKNGVVFEW